MTRQQSDASQKVTWTPMDRRMSEEPATRLEDCRDLNIKRCRRISDVDGCTNESVNMEAIYITKNLLTVLSKSYY
jgi:hypothetical protein